MLGREQVARPSTGEENDWPAGRVGRTRRSPNLDNVTGDANAQITLDLLFLRQRSCSAVLSKSWKRLACCFACPYRVWAEIDQ